MVEPETSMIALGLVS